MKKQNIIYAICLLLGAWGAYGQADGVSSLLTEVETERELYNRMTPPGISWVQPILSSPFSFTLDGFSYNFLEGLVPEYEYGVPVYPLFLELDVGTRETHVFNADADWLATLPAASSATIRPIEYPEGSDPSRVILQVDLIEAQDVEEYEVAESIFHSVENLRGGTQSIFHTVENPCGSASDNRFGFSEVVPLTNQSLRLTLTNAAGAEAELFMASAIPGTWTNGLSVALTNGAGVFEVEADSDIQFFAAAPKLDSDFDGLTDGMESFVYGTDFSEPDADGDGWNDGEEVAAGTDPHDRLSAPNPPARKVLIHALHYSTSSQADHYVQLHSSARYPINLSGFRLQVSTNGNFATRFTFPAGTIIRPGRFLLVGGENITERDFTAELGLPQSYPNYPTAAVRLMPPDGGGTFPADAVFYGTHTPFNDLGLPTDGWLTLTDGALYASTGSHLERKYLGHDNDARSNWTYVVNSSNPLWNDQTILDSDRDGILDGDEYSGGDNSRPPTDPQNPDSDNDGLLDGFELEHGLNPNSTDSDGNGINDGDEINPETGRTYAEDQLGSGVEVDVTSFLPNWNMGGSIGSNGWVRFEITDLDGIAIWASIREGGLKPENFTYSVSGADIFHTENSYVSGFRTVQLLLLPTDSNTIVSVYDGGTYWPTQNVTSLGPDISARFEAVRIEMVSDKAANSPKLFEGGKTTLTSPCGVSIGDAEALTVHYNEVFDSATKQVQDFNVILRVSPAGVPNVWTKISGPDSGMLVSTAQAEAIYENPKQGGVYQFESCIANSIVTRTQLWHPVAGPEIKDWVENEIAYLHSWVTNYNKTVGLMRKIPYVGRAFRGYDLLGFGMSLDWTSYYTGQSSPCIPFEAITDFINFNPRHTICGIVLDRFHISNCLTAYLARGMTKWPEDDLLWAFNQAGNPDDEYDIASYRIGFALFNNLSISLAMQAYGYASQEPDEGNWTLKLWPSEDEPTGGNIIRPLPLR